MPAPWRDQNELAFSLEYRDAPQPGARRKEGYTLFSTVVRQACFLRTQEVGIAGNKGKEVFVLAIGLNFTQSGCPMVLSKIKLKVISQKSWWESKELVG